jgi:hypothetical protein
MRRRNHTLRSFYQIQASLARVIHARRCLCLCRSPGIRGLCDRRAAAARRRAWFVVTPQGVIFHARVPRPYGIKNMPLRAHYEHAVLNPAQARISSQIPVSVGYYAWWGDSPSCHAERSEASGVGVICRCTHPVACPPDHCLTRGFLVRCVARTLLGEPDE